MPFPLYIVDAFTIGDDAFTGNPAAVCLLEFDDDLTDGEKQKVASEMNLSETAFVSEGWARGNPKLVSSSNANVEKRTLRWFTPTNEVALCGHATVASAKCLFSSLQARHIDEIEFESKFKGILGAKLNIENGLITLNFPWNPTKKLQITNNSWYEEIVCTTLGSDLRAADDVEDLQYSNDTKIMVIRLKDALGEEGLAKVKPSFQKLLEIDTGKVVHDIIVTVKGEGNDQPHFYSRFFAPWDGINEDPVTGLAHTVLTPYWTREYAAITDGKEVGTLFARQSSARGGNVHCLLQGHRVRLSGQAKITVKGELLYN